MQEVIKYNTDKEITLTFLWALKAHNTISINENQMLKGKRFIWYYWTKEARANY